MRSPPPAVAREGRSVGLKIMVCVKQVPDTEAKLSVASSGTVIDETGITFIMNPYDEFAVEEAVRIKEALGSDTQVTAVTVGPPRAEDALRLALAMGVDEAIRVWDAELAEQADGAAVAQVLEAVVRDVGFDLVLCGRMAIDDAQGCVGIRLAQRLGIPHLNAVTKLGVDGVGVTAHCEAEGGVQVVEAALPILVTAQKGLNEPRYPAIPAIMKARRRDIRQVSLGDLGLGADEIDGASLTSVVALEAPSEQRIGRTVDGETPEELARNLALMLRDEAKVL